MGYRCEVLSTFSGIAKVYAIGIYKDWFLFMFYYVLHQHFILMEICQCHPIFHFFEAAWSVSMLRFCFHLFSIINIVYIALSGHQNFIPFSLIFILSSCALHPVKCSCIQGISPSHQILCTVYETI